jgi:hypothetical protein
LPPSEAKYTKTEYSPLSDWGAGGLAAYAQRGENWTFYEMTRLSIHSTRTGFFQLFGRRAFLHEE